MITDDDKKTASSFVTARKAIVDATKGQRPATGSIPCPCCVAGTRQYQVASNGHILSICSSPDCVRWME